MKTNDHWSISVIRFSISGSYESVPSSLAPCISGYVDKHANRSMIP